ncbi:helix-turn-helix transcriptional regulator [Paraliobacillus ryukyuensis]|uniref:helix-turn-helix transcriptional regulator n=1 Tax=Paraliobacillus ryukyuensis TaxID=200904 RepID=UPI0009A83EDE|nr:helix-turn-helix transcriptional regulator [Paraliobacillus ryukyuensis]
MVVLYNKIKYLRKINNVSQQELAEFLEIERTSLSKIENMHYNPSARVMTRVADYFEKPIGEIFFNSIVSFDDTENKKECIS